MPENSLSTSLGNYNYDVLIKLFSGQLTKFITFIQLKNYNIYGIRKSVEHCVVQSRQDWIIKERARDFLNKITRLYSNVLIHK